MNIRHITATIAIMLAGLHSLSAQSLNQAFANELQQKGKGTTTIECLFSQTRHASFLQEDVRKEGVFYLKKPDNILLSYKDGEHIIMTAEWFEMAVAGRVTKTKVSGNPMLRSLRSILSACMLGDMSILDKKFEMTVGQVPGGWEVTMRPRRGRAVSKVSRILLRFDSKDMSLSLLKMEEKSGDYTLYEFYDKKINVVVADDLFRISR